MNEEDLVLIDENKSIPWNYVNRVERELAYNNKSQAITTNPLMPKSYKEVVMVLSRACNHSRVALLIDEEEEYVAFMLLVDGECIPFLLEDLAEIEMPAKSIYKVFTNDTLAKKSSDNGELQEFIFSTVIPDLNSNLGSWKAFRMK